MSNQEKTCQSFTWNSKVAIISVSFALTVLTSCTSRHKNTKTPEVASSVKDDIGGLGSTVASPATKAPPPAASKGMALKEGIASRLGAKSESGSSGDIFRPRPRSEEYRSRGSRQQGVSSNILTAGSFDDRDDVNLFRNVWSESPLASMLIPNVTHSDWRKLQRFPSSGPHDTLQLALVVDTTGSMGDELDYLKAEFRAIVREVDQSSRGVKKEVAVIVYRDIGDLYVTRGLNFTSDMREVQEFIDRQDAGGGGDYPEAVHTALQETLDRLDWNRRSKTARMVFHVADAPAHDQDMAETFRAVEKFANLGIAVFPVAASGAMESAEAMMRATALMTGGQYVFLTDDSGVGNSHAKPKHPCYNVEKLNAVMIRMIKDRIAGKKSAALASNVIRTVGNPDGQRCQGSQQYVRSW